MDSPGILPEDLRQHFAKFPKWNHESSVNLREKIVAFVAIDFVHFAKAKSERCLLPIPRPLHASPTGTPYAPNEFASACMT